MLVAIAAVVLAGVASYMSYEYAHKADSRAQKDVQRVDVLVAKSDILQGTAASDALNSGLIATKQVPKNILPPSAVSNAADLTNKIAVGAISKGQFIVSGSFVVATEVGGFSSQVPKGHQAITISVDNSHGVGGFVTPGDRVNVIYSGPVADSQGLPKSGGNDNKVSAFLVPSVRVLAVGSTTATATATNTNASTTESTIAGANNAAASTPQNTGLITLDVTPRQAEQIAQGLSLGSFYLTLDAPGVDPSKFTPPAEIVDTWNLFDQHLTTLGAARAAQ